MAPEVDPLATLFMASYEDSKESESSIKRLSFPSKRTLKNNNNKSQAKKCKSIVFACATYCPGVRDANAAASSTEILLVAIALEMSRIAAIRASVVELAGKAVEDATKASDAEAIGHSNRCKD